MANLCLPRWGPARARRRCIVALCCLLAAGLAGPGCEFPSGPVAAPRGGEGPGHRPQQLALSPREELELGRQAYREVLSNPRKYGSALPTDSPECQRVRHVARRIIEAAGIEPLQREINLRRGYRFEWEINVLDTRQANAFCLPGGKIAVFTGLLRITGDDDGQLATVLSHEIAHALAHHTSERVARGEINRGPFGGFWEKAFDRSQESEADHIGLFLMTFAGYDPEAAVRFWERMERAAADQPQPPELLSDHPSDARRIQDIRHWIPMARAAKQAYDAGRIEPPDR